MTQAAPPADIDVADLALVRDIEHQLRTYQLDGEAGLGTIMDPLKLLLKAQVAHAYGITEGPIGLRSAFVYSHLPSCIRTDIDEGLAHEKAEMSFAAFNLRCPEPEQRDRAFLIAPVVFSATEAFRILQKHDVHHNQIRALVCEGPSLLSWVGGFREEPFTTREVWLLDRLVGPLRERLSFERRIDQSAASSAALDIALEQIAAAVFVLDGVGTILHANTAGRSLLASGGRALARKLADARTGNDPDFVVRVTTARGQAPVYLVTSNLSGAALPIEPAAVRWRLTPRQSEVLSCVVQGYSNARIAAELRIAERTVEVHISAILQRAECTSRAELIVSVLATLR